MHQRLRWPGPVCPVHPLHAGHPAHQSPIFGHGSALDGHELVHGGHVVERGKGWCQPNGSELFWFEVTGRFSPLFLLLSVRWVLFLVLPLGFRRPSLPQPISPRWGRGELEQPYLPLRFQRGVDRLRNRLDLGKQFARSGMGLNALTSQTEFQGLLGGWV